MSCSTPSLFDAPLPFDAQLPSTPRSGCVELFEEIVYDWMCEDEIEWMEDEEQAQWDDEEGGSSRSEFEVLPITPDLSRSASSVFEGGIYLNGDDEIKGLGLYILPSKNGYFELPEDETTQAHIQLPTVEQKQPTQCDFKVTINTAAFSCQTWDGYSMLLSSEHDLSLGLEDCYREEEDE